MQKIKKKDLEVITALHQTIEAERDKYNSLVGELNAKIKAVCDEFYAQREDEIIKMDGVYQDAYDGLIECVKTQTDAMDSYIQERSNKWHDGEAGASYQAWFEEWQTLEDHIESYLDVGCLEGIDVSPSCKTELPSNDRSDY